MALWTRAGLALTATLLLSALGGAARAGDADLKQAIADLSAQAKDKARMDTLGASKVELSHIGTWLDEASNAVKEEAEEKCRKALDRVRAQIALVDQQVALSQLEAKAKRLDAALADANKALSAAKRELEDKQAKMRAMKMTQGQ
jgi:chromosome segregation ATPase